MFILIPVKIPRYDCNFCFNGRWLEDAHEAGSMPAGSSAQLSLAEPGLVVSKPNQATQKKQFCGSISALDPHMKI